MSLHQRQNRLVVMVKLPVAGGVKTRLSRDIGVARATSFYRHTTTHVVARLAQDGRWQTVLAVAPDNAVNNSVFPPAIARIQQGDGNLGQRMDRVMHQLELGPVVIIGSDCPALSKTHIKNAFDALGRHDAVIGPANDGGYWLIGLKRLPRCPKVFDDVRWSTAHACADTLRNMAGLRVARLETLSDVDNGADLKAQHGLQGRLVLPVA